MVLCPEAYERAQSEVDALIGKERLPELDDRPSLPYLECALKEVYRSVLRDHHYLKLMVVWVDGVYHYH